MPNYDFKLDLDTENSNSVIIKKIKNKSRVLEFGCAHGRMTKYLFKTLKCDTTIVEKDSSAAEVASKYVTNFQQYVGPQYGDIDLLYWYSDLLNKDKFDHIIFADVLEHIINSEKILKLSAELLKPNGTILISVPNISHNSVIIDLILDKFQYRDFGLLDKTHIKFFTESSIKEIVNQVGLKIKDQVNLVNVVENTEFNNKYEDLPGYVSNFLKKRNNAEVYQFVLELIK